MMKVNKEAKNMFYKLIITETGRDCLKNEPYMFNLITKNFGNLVELKQYLTEHYGKMPGGKKKIYNEKEDGTAQEIGFSHSFWNDDISHNSKAWYQTDWIEVQEIHVKPILL